MHEKSIIAFIALALLAAAAPAKADALSVLFLSKFTQKLAAHHEAASAKVEFYDDVALGDTAAAANGMFEADEVPAPSDSANASLLLPVVTDETEE